MVLIVTTENTIQMVRIDSYTKEGNTMSNAYLDLKREHQKEVNNFPIAFAFSGEQFKEAMKKLGLEPTDTDKVYSMRGTGGIYRKTDAPALREMFDRHAREMQEAIDADLTGDGFIFDMFSYELANHEYGYTWDIEPTLDALGLTLDEVSANEKLKYSLDKACRAQQGNE
jgi:hypothetical protein